MSSEQSHADLDLLSLIGSRICHDLISPIGAIGNGVELLSMSGLGQGPELALISDSVASANCRIRFFRIAFGKAAQEQGVSRAEVMTILNGLYTQGRLKIDWTVASDCRREEVKAAFLGILCLESAMPYGGQIRVTRQSGAWQLSGDAKKLKIDTPCWAVLGGAAPVEIDAPLVHFALFPEALDRIGRKAVVSRGDSRVELAF